MSSYIELSQLFARQQSIFKSIEVRSVAINFENSWRNIATSIRFSSMLPDEVCPKFDRIHSLFGDTRTTEVVALAEVLDFSQFQSIQDSLRDSHLLIDGYNILFDYTTDINTLKNTFPSNYSLFRNPGEWPFLEFLGGSRPSYLAPVPSILNFISRVNATDISSFISEWLDIDYKDNTSSDLFIHVPFYTSANNLIFEQGKITFEIRSHVSLLSDITIALNIHKGPLSSSQVIVNRSIPIQNNSISSVDFHSIDVAFEFDDSELTLESLTAITLTHVNPDALRLFSITRLWGNLLKNVPPNNPLFAAFNFFCSPAQLINHLSSPDKFRRKDASSSQCIFERAVSWLLTLSGFQTIWLEEYEELYRHFPSGKIRLESLDIIAYQHSSNTILLGACTLRRPSATELDSLAECRTIIRNSKDIPNDTVILCVYFCQADEVMLTSENADKIGIIVINRSQISELINIAKFNDPQETINNIESYSASNKDNPIYKLLHKQKYSDISSEFYHSSDDEF